VAQSDPATRPTLVDGALNGKPVVRFGGGQWLDGPAVLPEGCPALTIAAVWRRADTQGATVVCEQADDGPGRRASLLSVGDRYGFNGQNNDQHDIAPNVGGLWNLTVMTLDDRGMVRIWHNDERGGAGVCGQIVRPMQKVGARLFRVGGKITENSERLRGDVAEILVYDRALTYADVKALNEHLGSKWGVGKPDTAGRRSSSRTTPCSRASASRVGSWPPTPTGLSTISRAPRAA